jgi:hypothetical protein
MFDEGAERTLIQRLAGQFARGQVVLFTGAGFSLGATARDGQSVPSVSELKRRLWDIAFPGEDFDEDSTLGDIFEVALRTAGNTTRELFEACLRVEARSLPDSYGAWFSMPWTRIYTLNVDDLDEAVALNFDLPRDLEVVSALAREPFSARDRLLSVHLNGTLDDFPNVTFSQRQYGERLAYPEMWTQALVSDLRGMPVVYVGTTLDEPPLWQQIELRGRRGAGRELRPGSYLVAPSLPAARRAILKEQFNVDWIPLGADEFAERVLSQLDEAKRQGLEHFTQRARVRPVDVLLDVGELRVQPAQDLREYVMGREPVWADLGDDGFAIGREFEAGIADTIADNDARALLITGTGGSGKSTTLMRFALERQAAGDDVRWVDLTGEISLARLRAAIRESGADVVVIDDVDSFGNRAGPFIAEVLAGDEDVFVAAALRASRYEALDIESHLDDVPFVELVVPPLGDEDIDAILDALDRAQRLGVLRGMTRDEQRGVFARAAGRQLLVAMIEATTGERFDEKINRECRDLGPEAGLMYAVVALATAERYDLTRQQIALASGDTTNEGLNRLQGLVNRHLLVTTRGDRLRLRHRVIAEKAVEYFRRERQLGEAIRGLLFSLATGVDRRSYPRDRDGRLLVRLMNHDWLIRHLPGDRESVRASYDAVEDLLSWDYHYWLQRGSFEVEIGDLRLAQNLLEQARALAPDDTKVQTEWAYLVIKRAAQEPAALDARDRVEQAFLELEDAVARRGHQDSYPAHVMGSQGLAWVRAAPLSQPEKLGILARLRDVVDRALLHHPQAGDLRQLARDLEQEYLMVGAVRQP